MSYYEHKCPWNLSIGDKLKVLDVKGSNHSILNDIVIVQEIKRRHKNDDYDLIIVKSTTNHRSYGMNWHRFVLLQERVLTGLELEIKELESIGYRE